MFGKFLREVVYPAVNVTSASCLRIVCNSARRFAVVLESSHFEILQDIKDERGETIKAVHFPFVVIGGNDIPRHRDGCTLAPLRPLLVSVYIILPVFFFRECQRG